MKQLTKLCLILAFGTSIARADIYQWEYVNQADPSQGKQEGSTLCVGGAGVNAAPGANLDFRNLTMAYLIAKDLHGVSAQITDFSNADLSQSDLTGGELFLSNFAGANLSNANLADADLQASLANANLSQANLRNAYVYASAFTNANFTGAWVQGAYFGYATDRGFTAAQLYSTASYQAHDLTGISLEQNNLSGWNFAGQNLANANLNGYNLVGADFTGADLRSAIWGPEPGTITRNTIRPDGSIEGLALLAGEKLVTRNNPLAISVNTSATFDPASTLQFLLADNWTSPIGFDPGLSFTRNGTLDLEVASGVDPSTLLGQTFDLFDWTGVNPTGAFTISGPYAWDLSHLYTTGEVTLTAVPEPPSLILATVALLGFVIRANHFQQKLN